MAATPASGMTEVTGGDSPKHWGVPPPNPALSPSLSLGSSHHISMQLAYLAVRGQAAETNTAFNMTPFPRVISQLPGGRLTLFFKEFLLISPFSIVWIYRA